MIAKSAIEETTPKGHGILSTVFLVPKKDGGQRPESLNRFVHTEHFKMEGIHVLRDLLRAGDWMTKVDLKDAYFMVPIHREDRAFLKFTFREKTYQFRCLPFGLACAPWVFTKILKPLAAQLRQLGMWLIVYIDDILILAGSRKPAREHVIGLIYLCDKQTKMCPRTYSVHRVPWVLSELSSTRTEPSSGEGEKDQGQNSAPFWRAIRLQPESCPSFWADCKQQPGQYLWPLCFTASCNRHCRGC